jgi:hypothetical protein
MADKETKEVKKEEAKPEVLDYTVWHPDFHLNHIYIDEDGKKLIWTVKSMATEPALKYID